MTDLRRHVAPIALAWDAEVGDLTCQVVDGTLLFADVSGFTALTEKLARRGRIGAEEIVETLNRVFGPMLRIAAARGGELLKFGGDALLFLFRGPEHPEQACDAAVELRAALREAAAVPTSVGRLSLSMSIGVHAGDLHLFLVGAPTRELLVLGPGATATVQAEHAAGAGEIVVSAATAARLTPGAVRPRPDGQLLLRRRRVRNPAPGARPLPDVSPRLLRTLFPHALGEYLGPTVPDPEHRLASIAFIRFSGTDALLADAGPQAVADALDATLRLIQEALATEQITLLATDLDSDGGKCFLGAGIPLASDDNEGRMLRALRRIADAESPLPLQLGVNRGHVFAAEVGIQQRGAYTGMGDTTNTAARITARAPTGALYAHPAVLEHSRTRFAVTPAGPFSMKGKALPLLVYEVGAELGTREESAAQARLPFLGRKAEMGLARSAVEDALGGAGSPLTVTGPTGVGKTRLVREALGGLAVDHLVVVRSEPYGVASPYRVLRDPLRLLLGLERGDPQVMGDAMLGALARSAPDLLPMAPLLADVAQVDVPATPEVEALDPQYRAVRLADTVVQLVERTLPGRVVLVAEDAHWADAASAALLDRVARAADQRPWAVVVTRRPDAGGCAPADGARVELEPLAPAVIERLVIAATEATPLRPHEIAAVVDRAQGSPLYVEEVTRVAVGTGSLDALPESVGAAMGTLIDALPPHARRILRYCAVLGRSFRVAMLQEVLAADELELTPDVLAALDAFLEEAGPGRMRFRNSLVRDAAYEGLAFRSRTRMHRVAGQTLERITTDPEADAPILALHFWYAGDAERTWIYARMAGEEARRAYANVDAIEQYERALEASRRVPEVSDVDRTELWAILGELRELAGVLDGSVDAFRRAESLVVDPVARVQLMARRVRVLERSGAYTSAIRTVARARRTADAVGEVDSSGPAHRARVRLDLQTALVRLGQERHTEARGWAVRAAEGAREVGDADALVQALRAIDYADFYSGVPVQGEHTREALEICLAEGLRTQESALRANLGGFAYVSGRWDEAVDWYQSSRTAALAVGNTFGAAETDLSLGDVLVSQGRVDEAEALLHDAVRTLRAIGMAIETAYGESLLARVELARGHLDAAKSRIVPVIEQMLASGHWLTAFEASLVHARIASRAGAPDDALRILAEAERASRGEAALLHAATCVVQAEALLLLDRLEACAKVVDAGLTAAREKDLPYEEGLLLRVRSGLASRCGDATAAEADATDADRILGRLGALQ